MQKKKDAELSNMRTPLSSRASGGAKCLVVFAATFFACIMPLRAQMRVYSNEQKPVNLASQSAHCATKADASAS